MCHIFGLQTSNLVRGWNTMARITDQRVDLKGQRSRSPYRLTTWPNISHIFRMARPRNFKLDIQMEYDDPHQWHARWPQRSKVKVIMSRSRRQFDACFPITGQCRRLPVPRVTLHTSSKIKRSKVKVTTPTNNSSYIGRVISFYFVFVFVFVPDG